MSNQKHFATHLTLDFSNCDKEKLKDIEHIKSFVEKLLIMFMVQPVSGPQIIDTGSGNNKGYTLVQLTKNFKSTILAHFCEESGDLYLDIVACGYINPDKIVGLVEKYFTPSNFMKNFVIRDANPTPKGWLEDYSNI